LCPAFECKSRLDAGVVREVLDDEDVFAKYDSALLHVAIRQLSSTVWCPRWGNKA
jgi:hypothetical protein